MDLLEGLKLKYAEAIGVIKEKGVVLAHMHMEGEKLYLKGSAPNENVKNDVWNAVKAVGDSWHNEITLDLDVDTSLPQPVRTYTVVGGDSLWKIADHFYGNGSKFPKIIAGNPDKLKDEKSVIHPGDVLVIPD
jgi:nucleoid-associated protein YgaU